MPWWLRLVLSGGVIALLVWKVILPELDDSKDAFASLAQLSLPLVVLALVLELTSLILFTMLTAAVLGRPRPGYPTLLRIDLSVLAMNHVLPGGGATSAALRFRLLVSQNLPPARALSAAAIQSVGANLVLGAVFLTGLVVSLTTFVDNPYYLIAGATVLGLLLVTGIVVWLLVRHTEASVRVARRGTSHLPFVSGPSVESLVRTVSVQARELLTDRRHLGVVLALAVGNWLLDAAALWVVLQAFGSTVHLGVLLTVYGVGNLLALLPITPGGLGIVESVMVSSLIGFGTSAPVALLGVIGWRLMEFWLPLPLGAAAYLSLRAQDLWRRRHPSPSDPRNTLPRSGRPALLTTPADTHRGAQRPETPGGAPSPADPTLKEIS